jgi:hypothetical protein
MTTTLETVEAPEVAALLAELDEVTEELTELEEVRRLLRDHQTDLMARLVARPPEGHGVMVKVVSAHVGISGPGVTQRIQARE